MEAREEVPVPWHMKQNHKEGDRRMEDQRYLNKVVVKYYGSEVHIFKERRET